MAGRVGNGAIRFALVAFLLSAIIAIGASGADARSTEVGTNPAIDADAPDPTIIRSRLDGAYYAFTTNAAVPTGVANVPTWRSWDLKTWEYVGDALPDAGSWVTQAGEHWAPDVALVGDRYVLYYTAHGPDGRLCIGVATSSRLDEPFVPSDAAVVCPSTSSSGLIDPSVTVTGTDVVLLYKNLGSQQIVGQSMTADGLRTDGAVTTILNPDASWQGDLVENPSLVRVNGFWLLAYSARDWRTADYVTGWAVCESPLGPCRNGGILLDGQSGLAGPGGLTLLDDGSSSPIVVFHAWTRAVGYEAGGYRALYTGRLALGAYGPTIVSIGLQVRSSAAAVGSIDVVGDVGDGTVRVEGWAMDHASRRSATIHVYVDGRFVEAATADRRRADVAAALGNGADHGFAVAVPAGRVCVYVLTASGTNPLVGCRTAGTTAPTGVIDVAHAEGDSIRLAGWAADPNTPTYATEVHLYVDGLGYVATTEVERTDVSSAHPSIGTHAGFDALVPATGARRVCAYAINTGPGANTLLGCVLLS
jgi:hypothetical protein